jgi:signal transduction protein with GAF and PtsI domain
MEKITKEEILKNLELKPIPINGFNFYLSIIDDDCINGKMSVKCEQIYIGKFDIDTIVDDLEKVITFLPNGYVKSTMFNNEDLTKRDLFILFDKNSCRREFSNTLTDEQAIEMFNKDKEIE